jgi:glutathione S-transferase
MPTTPTTPTPTTVAPPAMPIRLYRHPLSGHSHRVELFLSLLGLPFERIDVDLLAAEHKKPPFLAKNPLGQVPVIEDGELTLADSNAILVYLAGRYGDDGWLPREPSGAAAVQRYLSLAAGELAAGPMSARLVVVFGAARDHQAAIAASHRLLAILEAQLAARAFLVGPRATIADVAHYTYVAHAPEGGVSLAGYPNVRGWVRRVEGLPGFLPMRACPVTVGQ